jgi:hypothetical protein
MMGSPTSAHACQLVSYGGQALRGTILKLEGVYSVLPTPFGENGDVDEASLRRVVELFIAAGVN